MAVNIMVEVMDHWQDAGLTAGERDDLIVLAENVNPATRLTWGGVHEPYILKRVGKSATSWKNSIGKLIKKGVLVQHTAGHKGRVAVYRIPVLCPEPPHHGWHGYCTRPERVTSEVTQYEEAESVGHSSGDPMGAKGHLTGDQRVTPEVTPTLLVSSGKNPPPPGPGPAPTEPAAEAKQGGREGAALEECHRPAYDALLRITASEPRLSLGEQELARLAPLVTPWLERADTRVLQEQLTAGLPAQVGSPVGLLRTRLLSKLPPPRPVPVTAGSVPAADGLPPWCGRCGDGAPAEFNARFRVTGLGVLCHCHPNAF